MIKKLRLMIIVPLISGLFACTGAEYVAVELGVNAVAFAVDSLSKPSKKNKELKDFANHQICFNATDYEGKGWFVSGSENDYVGEAKKRGFNVEGCNQLTGRGNANIASLKEYCSSFPLSYKCSAVSISSNESSSSAQIVQSNSNNANKEVYLNKGEVDLLCEATNSECEKNKERRSHYQRYLNSVNNNDGLYRALAFQQYRILDSPAYGVHGSKSDYVARNNALKTCEKYASSSDVARSNCIIVMYGNKVINSKLKNKILELRKRKLNINTTKIASSITDQYVCQRATKSDGSSFESFSSNYADYVEEAGSRGLNLESCNQLTGRGTNQTVTQTVQVPKTEVDKIAPTLEIEDRIIVDTSDYTIRGKVFDDSKVYIQVDGNTISSKNGSFTINGYIPIGEQRLTIVAKDQWGNTSKKNITVERVMRSAKNNNSFEKLNPNKIRSKKNKNRIALIIGIEKYNNISDAKFAKNDAVHFIDYAQTALGVPQNNIKYFFDESAGFKLKIEIKRWLKKNVRKNSEVFIYFSGHGIAQNDGQELYLLTNNTESDFIHETAINRNEIFNDIAQYNPKSVNVFLDTCYSGAGRADGEILLAMAKGLVVVDEQQQQLPDNFTLFTAASAQESAWSLPEAKHGTFSYFLMKGMEGEADLDGDNRLTNGELQEYLLDNVGRYAQQQQTPQMIGDPDQVLVRF